jgi:hypothetical protein
MPFGGETVGDAYIRILADGSGLDRSIRDEFRKRDKDFDSAGREHARSYHEGFDDEFDKLEKLLDNRSGQLTKHLYKQDREFRKTGDLLGGHFGDSLLRSINKAVGKGAGSKEISDRIFRQIEEAVNASDRPLETLQAKLGQLNSMRAKAIADIQRDEDKLASQESAASRKRVADLAYVARLRQRYMNEEHAQAIKLNSERISRERTLTAQLNSLLDDRYKQIADKSRKAADYDSNIMRRRVDDAIRESVRGNDGLLTSLRHDLLRFNDEASKGLIRVRGFTRPVIRDLGDVERRFGRVEQSVRRMGDALGKATGKGSRNDFFNFMGSVIGELGTMAGLASVAVPHGIARMVGAFKDINDSSDTFLGKVHGMIDALAGGLSGAIGKAVAGLIGFGALVGSLASLLGPVISAVSLLGGAVVALSGAVGFGLVGALGAALPLVAPLVAGIGAVTIALVGADKQTKAYIKNATKPLRTEWAELTKVVRKNVFSQIGQQAKLLAPVLKRDITPTFGLVGKAVAGLGTQFAKLLGSGPMKQFFDSMRTFLPHSVTALGTAFIRAFGGMATVIRLLVPYADKLSAALLKGATNFQRFINSSAGQAKFSNFMARAWDSAHKLWTMLRLTGKVLGDLLSAGQHTGNNFLDSINSSLSRFDKWMRSGAGITAMRGFFSDVETFVHHLGNAMDGIGRLFSALDNDASRSGLNRLLDGIKGFGDLVGNIIDNSKQFQTAFYSIISSVSKILSTIARDVIPIMRNVLGPALAVLAFALGKFADFLASHAGAVKTFGGAVVIFLAAWKTYTIVGTAVRFILGRLTAMRTALDTTATRMSAFWTRMRTGNSTMLSEEERVAQREALLAAQRQAVIAQMNLNINRSRQAALVQQIENNRLAGISDSTRLEQELAMLREEEVILNQRAAAANRTAAQMAAAGSRAGLGFGAALTRGLSAGLGGLAVGSLAGSSAPGGLLGKILIGAGGGAALGSMFGGWGALIGGAVGGVSAAVSGLIDKNQKAKESSQEYSTQLQQQLQLQKQLVDQYSSALDASNGKLDANVRKLIVASLQSAELAGQGGQKTNALSEFNRLGVNLSQVTSAASGNQQALASVTTQLYAMNAAGKLSGSELENLLGIINKQSKAAADAAGQNFLQAEALGKLRKLTVSAADEFKQFGSSLDDSTVAGQNNLAWMREHITAAQQSALSDKKVSKSAQDASLAFIKQTAALAKNAVKAGANQTQVQALLDTIGKLPDTVTSKMSVDTKVALEQIKTASEQLAILGAQKPAPTVELRTEQAEAKRKLLITALHFLGQLQPTPEVRAAIKSAQNSLNTINRQLGDTGRQRPTPTAAVKDAASAEIKKINTKVSDLNARRATIDVNTRGNAWINLLQMRNLVAELAAANVYIGTSVGADGRIHIIGGGSYAAGGILNRPTILNRWGDLAGEAGPEAIVPLRRPLSQVDPSVRYLAAIAQGKDPSKYASGGMVNTGKSVTFADGAITIVSPNNPKAVAAEFLNEMAGRGYL